MDQSAIEQILDDAVNLVVSGQDPQLCADCWPAHRNELQPLLFAAHELRAYAEESAEYLRDSDASRRPIDWVALLADVPQLDEQPGTMQHNWPATCPTRKAVVPASRSSKSKVAARSRSLLH